MVQIICEIIIDIIMIVFMIIVGIKTKSLKKAKEFLALEKEYKGGNEMKKQEILNALINAGLSENIANKMLNVLEVSINVGEEITDTVDGNLNFQNGEAFARIIDGKAHYYTIKEDIK